MCKLLLHTFSAATFNDMMGLGLLSVGCVVVLVVVLTMVVGRAAWVVLIG